MTAEITDGNGTDTVVYQWQSDDVDITGATLGTYSVTSDDLGTVLSVSADYTDSDGFTESLTAEHNDVVYSFITTGEQSLDLH